MGIIFSPWCSEHPWERLLSQYNPNLSIDLCNVYCSGLEKNGKLLWEEILFLWFLSDISKGSAEGLEFPKPESP